jgi:DNA-directed RNA polymerase
MDYGQWQLGLDAACKREIRLNAQIRTQRLQELQLLSKSAHGRHIFQQCVDAVARSVNETCCLALTPAGNGLGKAGPYFSAVNWLLQMESPQQIAALALTVVIDSISRETKWTVLVNRIGAFCETETRAGRLKAINPSLFKALRSNFKGRALTYAFSSRKLEEYGIARADWGAEGRATVGAFLLDRVIEATGLVHHTWHKTHGGKRILYIQPATEVLQFLKQLPPTAEGDHVTSAIRVVPPAPWGPDNIRSYNTGSIEGGLIRLPSYAATQREELALDWLPPGAVANTLAAANTLQRQSFTFSAPLTVLADELWSSGRHDIAALFPCHRDPTAIPPFLEAGATEYAWKARNRAAALAYQDHRVNNPKRIAIARTIHTAKRFAGHTVFLTTSADYRGRLYTNGELTYQGSPLPRALTHFQPTDSLSPDGFNWCLRTAAAAYLGRRISFDDRLTWAQQHLDLISTVASDPQDHTHLWTTAADPWRFVAAAIAIHSHLQDPATPIGLPIPFDQSCSGLGHIAALTRDLQSAIRTRLTAGDGNDTDLYSLIAADLFHQAELDFHAPPETASGNPNQRIRNRASFWLKHGIQRHLIKEAVISSPYGITPFGIRQLISEQLIKRCHSKDPKDLLAFVDGPALYLSEIFAKVMAPHLKQADALKTWLKSIASTVGKLNHPLHFTAPSGLIIRDAELTTTLKEFPTVLNGRHFAYHHTEPDTNATINTRKLSSRIVANYIHSIDASLCTGVINSCNSLNIPIATVHDCFSTTPNHASTLHSLLLSQIRSLHSSSWLEIHRQELQSRYSITIPSPPVSGDLDPDTIGSCPSLFC